MIPIPSTLDNNAIGGIVQEINEYLKEIGGMEIYWINIQCEISNPNKENGYFVFIKKSDGDASEEELDETGNGIKIKMLQQK